MTDAITPERDERFERMRHEVATFLRAAGRPMVRAEIEAGLVLMRNSRLCKRWLSPNPPDRFEGYTLSGVGPALARMIELGEVAVTSEDGEQWMTLSEAESAVAEPTGDDGLKAVDAHLALAKLRAANCLKRTPRLPPVVHSP